MSSKLETVKVYGVPFSVHTRKVVLAASLKRIPHEVVPVVPVDANSLPPSWTRISPTGLIPAIEHDGFTLSDSTAIALYLERLVPEPPLLPPNPRDYARALSLDAWAGTLFQRVVQPLFHQLVVGPRLHGAPSDAALVDAARRKSHECFAFLEGITQARFLVASRLSLADLAVVSNLIVFRYLGQRLDGDLYPNLDGYFRNHVAEPAFAAALERERPFVEQMGLDPALT